MTSKLPEIHAAFVETLSKAVAQDHRFQALLAGGSLIDGSFDEHSDLDFVIVVEDDLYDGALTSRLAFAETLGPLLSAFTGEHVGEPRLLICLYGPPLLHVDLKFITASALDGLIEQPAVLFARNPDEFRKKLADAPVWPDRSPEWFEARAWVWLHYAVTKLARGELFEALGMLAFFRDQVLGPMLHRRAGRKQRGVRRIEMFSLDPDGLLKATVAGHDAASTREALRLALSAYLDLREDRLPKTKVDAAPRALLDMLDAIGTNDRAPAQRLFLTSVLVRDYEEAIDFYRDKLGFVVREDSPLSDLKRWVVLAPAGGGQACILLAKASTPDQVAHIGHQAGGRVFLFLETDDFDRDYRTYTQRGVKFMETPRTEIYGKVAVFEDLYGNRWDLIEAQAFLSNR